MGENDGVEMDNLGKNVDVLDTSSLNGVAENNDDVSLCRRDESGNLIKNIENHPNVFSKLSKFSTAKKLSINAIIIVFKKIEKPDRSDVYELLNEMDCRPSDVKGIVRRGGKGFTVEFKQLTWKKNILSLISEKYSSDEVTAFPCIPDEKKITVGGVPSHLDNADILEFLEIFGDFYTDNDKIINRKDDFGVEKGERVYTCKKLHFDIISSYQIYGHTLTFRYPGQPHTCVLCHQRGHSANECDVTPNNHHLVHPNQTESSNSSSYGYAKATIGKNTNLRPGGSNSNFGGLKRSWRDGGSSMSGGMKPKYLGSSTLGDHMTPLSRNGGKLRKVTTWSAEESKKKEKLVSDINSNIIEAERVMADAIFSDEKMGSGEQVNKSLLAIKNLLPPGDDEWEPVVDGSPENIRRLFEYDIQLLNNCSRRSGGPISNRLESKKFRGMLENYIEVIEANKQPSSNLQSDK